MMYLSALSCLALLYAVTQLSFYLRRRRLFQRSWEDLLGELQTLNLRGIEAIAESYLNPSGKQLHIEPDVMWMVVGETEGLRSLKMNAKVMLELAVYAEQWNHVEGRIVAEMMRRDAVRLNRAIRRIELAVLRNTAGKYAAFELQEAIASYQLMRKRLLGLYEVAHIWHYQTLAARV